jgi:hypothetical protein
MEGISAELFDLINNNNPDLGDTQEEQDEMMEDEEVETGEGSITDFSDNDNDDFDGEQDADIGTDEQEEEAYEEEEIEYLQSQFAEGQGFESWEEMVEFIGQAKENAFETEIQEPDYDPEIVRLKELKEEGIDIFEAAAIMQADFTDLSNPKEILLSHFILEHPELTNEEAEEFFEDQFAREYDEEDKISMIKMKTAVKKAAKDLIQFQNYLKEPVTKIEDLRKHIKKVEFNRNNAKNEINISQEAVDTYSRESSEFLNKKTVAFSFDEGQGFNYQFSKEMLSEAFDKPTDFINQKLQSYVKDLQTGKVDFDGLAKLFVILENPDKFVKNIVNHGKALGKEQILRSMKNPSERTTNNDTNFRTKEPISDDMAKVIGLAKATR